MLDIGTLGGTFSRAVAVSPDGLVIGRSQIAGDIAEHAFAWSEATGMIDLGTLGGANSSAAFVNASNLVVGASETTSGYRAFAWSPGSHLIDLGSLGGETTAYGLNDNGLVVGYSQRTSGAYRAFAWTTEIGIRDLGTLGTDSFATAVNSAGVIGGYSYNPLGAQHAVAWSPITETFEFSGFLPPVNNPPALNTVNAGSSVVFKFRLNGNRGLGIFDPGSPSVVACNTLLSATSTAASSATNTLTYDAKSDTYSYSWKTDKAWAGACYQFRMALRDGGLYTASFLFK
jgi:probable HAF family extracellular repeat protein